MNWRRSLRSTGLAGLFLAAQLSPSITLADQWSGNATVYGWLPWMDIEVTPDSGEGSVDADISGSDVLDALSFTLMAAGEVYYGRIGLFQDFIYSDLEAGGQLSGPLAADIDAEVKMIVSLTAIGYKVYEEDRTLVEPFAGARYVRIRTDVGIEGGGPVGVAVDVDSKLDWWDPVIGVRGRIPVTRSLTAQAIVDIGGFGVGSDFTWEIYAGLGYALSERWSASLGFRYMSIDYDSGNADLQMEMYGPLVGLTAHF